MSETETTSELSQPGRVNVALRWFVVLLAVALIYAGWRQSLGRRAFWISIRHELMCNPKPEQCVAVAHEIAQKSRTAEEFDFYYHHFLLHSIGSLILSPADWRQLSMREIDYLREREDVDSRLTVMRRHESDLYDLGFNNWTQAFATVTTPTVEMLINVGANARAVDNVALVECRLESASLSPREAAHALQYFLFEHDALHEMFYLRELTDVRVVLGQMQTPDAAQPQWPLELGQDPGQLSRLPSIYKVSHNVAPLIYDPAFVDGISNLLQAMDNGAGAPFLLAVSAENADLHDYRWILEGYMRNGRLELVKSNQDLQRLLPDLPGLSDLSTSPTEAMISASVKMANQIERLREGRQDDPTAPDIGEIADSQNPTLVRLTQLFAKLHPKWFDESFDAGSEIRRHWLFLRYYQRKLRHDHEIAGALYQLFVAEFEAAQSLQDQDGKHKQHVNEELDLSPRKLYQKMDQILDIIYNE